LPAVGLFIHESHKERPPRRSSFFAAIVSCMKETERISVGFGSNFHTRNLIHLGSLPVSVVK
jgi:hypothetical protein